MATSNFVSNSSIAEPVDGVENLEGEELLEPGSGDGTLLDALQTQFGTTPWWVVSAVVHALLLLLIMMIGVALSPPVQDEVVLESPPPAKPVEQLNENLKRDLFKKIDAPMQKQEENPMIVREPVPDDHFETENEMDKNTARGQEDAISDIPLGGTGVAASIGVGGGGMAGCYGFRDGGGRKKATLRWGGSSGSENAVEAALAWLHRHQEPDGHWESMKWEGSKRTDPGITGLALLAFLGAGYTETEGKYTDTVRRATQWIIKQQQADGSIGKGFEGSEHEGDIGYHHSICGLALAEAHGMSSNSATAAAAQKAVDYSVNTHQFKDSGWRYVPGQEGGADLSVTGWFVMQLKSATIAGLRVPSSALQGATLFTDSVSDQYGKCRYQPSWQSPTHTMTSVGMLVRLYTGSHPTDAKVAGGANYLIQKLPIWGEHGAGVDMYYWYYGTMTLFQVGGDPWKKWNTALRDMLCDNQRVGGPKDGSKEDVDGSWDPVCAWAARGGRVYSTAVGALCLEVYYRYLPLYRQ
jgi:hypothetical protein